MRREMYENWSITTERPDYLTDIVKINFENLSKGNEYTCCRISKDLKTNAYVVEGNIFGRNFKYVLRTQRNDDNYHSLIDEANDVIRGWLTVLHEDILTMIDVLPEI